MKDQKNAPLRLFYLGFLSFFGTGFAPKAPGTFGSLATIPLILFFAYINISLTSLVIFIVILTIMSCFIADYAQRQEQVHALVFEHNQQ